MDKQKVILTHEKIREDIKEMKQDKRQLEIENQELKEMIDQKDQKLDAQAKEITGLKKKTKSKSIIDIILDLFRR